MDGARKCLVKNFHAIENLTIRMLIPTASIDIYRIPVHSPLLPYLDGRVEPGEGYRLLQTRRVAGRRHLTDALQSIDYVEIR